MVNTRTVSKKIGEILPDCDEKAIEKTVDASGSIVEWNAEEFLLKKFKHIHHYRFILQGGYLDDLKYKLPYRHLTNWFFARTMDDAKGNSLTNLPNDHIMRNIVVFGEMEPNQNRIITKGMDLKNVKIVIRHPKIWTIDRSHDGMGYWIQTKLAWYYLKQPEKELKCPRNICKKISMEQLFLPHRARLGLLSNIVDMLGETHPQERTDKFPYYASIHRNSTPEQCHSVLSPSDDILAENEGLNKEPFNLNFLQGEGATFVYQHLQKVFKDLVRNSVFMQGLKHMKQNYERKKRNKEYMEQLDYETIALEAEARSLRTPWGEKKKNFSTRINKLLEVQGGNKHMNVQSNNHYLREQLRILKKVKEKSILSEKIGKGDEEELIKENTSFPKCVVTKTIHNTEIIEILESDSDDSDDSEIEILAVVKGKRVLQHINNIKCEDKAFSPEKIISCNPTSTGIHEKELGPSIHLKNNKRVKQENDSLCAKKQKIQLEEKDTQEQKVTLTQVWDEIEQSKSSLEILKQYSKEQKAAKLNMAACHPSSTLLQHLLIDVKKVLKKFKVRCKEIQSDFDDMEKELCNVNNCSELRQDD